MIENLRVAVVGLGYVGLPLAVAFGQHFQTIGYDHDAAKLAAFRQQNDPTGEVSADELQAASRLEFTDDPHRLACADFIVVAVPTPVDEAKRPDFACLLSASETVGRHLKPGAIVIYESTVYPGATREICIPALEKSSGKRWQEDFFVGYSPERINPGDREHRLSNIVKVVSGDSAETLEQVAALYATVVTAGVHRAASIEVAEAAKVIENTQRDLNIALMNELAIIFDRLGLETSQVLAAAATKWNFLPFRPGLVGGHCIGVDPYYLTYKAQMLGYHPQVILAGRRINDGMAKFIAEKTIKLMIREGRPIKGSQVIVLGLTFKENCADIRNSKVADLVRELEEYGCRVWVHDPLADPLQAEVEYGITLFAREDLPESSDAVVIAVGHSFYRQLDQPEMAMVLERSGVIVDVKALLPSRSDGCFWQL